MLLLPPPPVLMPLQKKQPRLALASSMSRRKQAKPQHLASDGELLPLLPPGVALCRDSEVPGEGPDDADSGNESRSGSEETNVCEKCCAEFFKWTDFMEHKNSCTKSPLVLIMNNEEAAAPLPTAEEFAEPSPASSPSNHDGSEAADENIQTDNNDSCEPKEDDKEEEPMDIETPAETSAQSGDTSDTATPLPQIPEPSSMSSYTMPNTNVTLETLHSTKVAVAQFSQTARSLGGAHTGPTALAIPIILEQLMALQQQQIHQLQLIEQIRSQVALMNRQPLRPALTPAAAPSQAAPLPASNPLQGFTVHSALHLAAVVPSTIAGPACNNKPQTFENSQHTPQPTSGTSTPNIVIGASCALTESSASSTTNVNSVSLTPPTSSAVSICSRPPNPSTPPTLGHGPLTSASSLPNPLLPQSSPNSVIFPNPLVSIAATANALDPLSALMKHRKGKPPNVSVFEPKATSEDPFFKHKCRFCAKVFGSDSALQIHLRSHTGERPFKCNICGNRFSTKGNLKVHFQRHKEKYPHIQMNPYPVPEYLDNVPTSSGIPYGMSLPPEKPVTTWLDSKPVLPTISTSIGLQLPPTIPGLSNYGDSPCMTPMSRSPQRPSPPSSECNSLSPSIHNSESGIPTTVESPQPTLSISAVTKLEPVLLPPTSARLGEQHPLRGDISSASTPPVPTTTDSSMSTSLPNPVLPSMSDQFKAKFPFGGLLDSMQTSETSKLQQLVENIDKKMTDPNQCVICHRVLSCQSALKMHYRTHTGERPFKCKICGRAFTTKGNLKTHFGVHRAKPPLRVQHSCPICQKKFTNAVVLQQHIRMHMGGQIPNTPLPEGFQDAMDSDLSYDDKNMDSLSNYDDDFDDNSMEEDLDLKDTASESSKPFISYPGSCPTSPPSVISSIAALENQMRMIDSVMNSQQLAGMKCLENGSAESDHLSNDSSSAAGDLESQSAGSPAMSESSSSMQVLSPANSNSESIRSKSPVVVHIEEPQEIKLKKEKPDSPPPAPENGGALDLRSTTPVRPAIKEETPFSLLFLSRDRGKFQSTVCNVCGKPFACKSALEIHYRSHTKERPFVCTICSRGCSTMGNLKQHLLTHELKELPSQLFEPNFTLGPSQTTPTLVTSTAPAMIKMEVNGHSKPISLVEGPHLPAGIQVPAAPQTAMSPGINPMLAPPPRRTPKQHNCHSCGKTFSSASALQIHERTHTGEKPFGCTICGRAFTTKGNLKVHMGTHMWNNAPARRGRRLSVENPIALLGGDALKFSEMFQKDLAARAMNVDPSFWNQYAAAITNGLAMKNNEISVIQNGGLPQLPISLGGGGLPSMGNMGGGMDRMRTGSSPTTLGFEKLTSDATSNRPFARFLEENKEIGIN